MKQQTSATTAKSTKRQSKICKRCHRRKQRCHGFPVCTNCEQAGEHCEQSELALQLHRHSPALAALKRIQSLESQLESTQQALNQLREQNPSSTPRAIDYAYGTSSPPCENLTGGNVVESQPSPSLHNPATQQPQSDNAVSGRVIHQQHQVDPMIESNLEHIVQATVWTKALSPTLDANQPLPVDPSQLQKRCAGPPGDELGTCILDTYFAKIHPRYPFFDRREAFDLHATRHDLVSDTQPARRLGTFRLFMLYAIGATMLRLTGQYDGEHPDRFFMTALQNMSAARQSHSVHNIEAMILLVLYNLRSPFNSGIWYMVGLAMRTCIDMGMHRETVYNAMAPRHAQLRRRLFWSVYLLERGISLSLGRPFSVSDRDIDIKAPRYCEDAADNLDVHRHIFWAHYVEGKRFESRVHAEIYSLGETQEVLFGKVRPLLESLDTWRQSVDNMSPHENDYMDLQWNKSSLLVIRPFLSRVRQDDPLIKRCLVAAGQVCEIFKRLHQRDSYGHSFISAHTVFIAGVTMCYCLFRAPSLFTMTVANNLRACSSTIFVMAERTPSVKKHRDVLESTISRAMDSVWNTSPSTSYQRNGNDQNLGKRNLSPHDLLAVQSLMGLSAQQDPSSISPSLSQSHPTSESAPSMCNTGTADNINGGDYDLGCDFRDPLVNQKSAFVEISPDAYAVGSGDVCQDYGFSFQMLQEMMH